MTNIIDFKFDWTKEMETGCTLIDNQHKELFRIGREVEQYLICYCIGVTPKQILYIISELRNFVAYSFYQEENFMRDLHYPKIKQHLKEHMKITEYIISLDANTILNDTYNELSKLKIYLQDLIFSHILICDKDLGNYVKANT